jgi:HD-GYP domain-containing protein (c-di-GMP phosphodiesterase class II)
LDDYKEELLQLYQRRDPDGYSIGDIFHNILMPLEYLLQIDVENICEREADLISGIYNDITNYVFCMQNTGSFSYLLEYFVAFMRKFVELPGQMTFLDACLNGIAALHPPTYVHTIMVGRIAKNLCRHLIRMHPEAFVGVLGYKNEEEVKEHRFELEEFIYRGGLCHDIGKFLIMDTIFIYGRNLTDDEFDIIKRHPEVGAQIMSSYSSTRPYADIARGHHRFYNNQAGYPNYNTEESDIKLLIDLVACADCLDAATDTVGRSYNTGKSLSDVFAELIEQSGTRYTPYIAELLENEETRRDIEYLLKDGRKEVYYNTFVRLVAVQKSVQ